MTTKAALISNLATADFNANQRRILKLAVSALEQGAKFLLFPEAAATGLCDTGDPAHDLKIAEPIPGSLSEEWRRFAKEHTIWLAAGLLERDGGRVFDSAILFNPQGKLALHYRRIDPHWHRPGDDSAIYCVGADLPVIQTPLGRTGFLICGDLWDDETVRRFKESRADILLYPFLRSIGSGNDPSEVWSEELRDYQERWVMTNATVLAVNLYQGDSPDASIGGAWYVGKEGGILESIPILEEGILIVDLPDLG